MRTTALSTLILCTIVCIVLAACNGDKNEKKVVPTVDYTQVATPTFDSDSAYAFIEAQTAFGFRAPGHKGHDECANYLVHTMRRWCDSVMTQPFNATLWDGTAAHGQNIISIINPDATTRVLLAAHWDSRLWADQDDNTASQHSPILGANDGASGVAVLMELARVMQSQRPDIGIDIIFFDLEDQGLPEWEDRYEDDTWCKGAQHWARTPHTPYYQARYGILLDMVGATQPRFTKEMFSVQYATTITDRVWDIAAALGYAGIFENTKTDPILDDHLYVNRLRGIPMVDIVQNDRHGSFFPYWHTTGDNLQNVDRQTLAIIGRVLLTTIYSTAS